MSVTPIRGKWDNIPALLNNIASDPSVGGIVVFTLHDVGTENERFRSCTIDVSRANMAFVAACLLRDAIDPEE